MNEQSEQTIATGTFGTVTNKRVIYQRSKGWFRGGSREGIPLKHVTSVRLEISRHVLGGILLALIGLPCLGGPRVGLQMVGVLLTALAIVLLWGSPKVVVNTGGQDKNASHGWPWERLAATGFVEAVRQQLVAE